MKKLFLCLVVFISIDLMANGPNQLSVSNLFTDGMVLQQRSEAAIWGWNAPGETVSIKTDWGKVKEVATNGKGKWSFEIKTPEAGGPYIIKIWDKDSTLTIENVLLGEVWVCSGQSNMDMPLAGWVGVGDTINNYKQEIDNANYPKIRMFNVGKRVAIDPEENVQGRWMECTPELVGKYSAAGYFFGRELYQNLEVPIGLIHTSFGASPAEAWTSLDGLMKLADFDTINQAIDEVRSKLGAYNTWFNGLEKLDYSYARHHYLFDGLVLKDSLFMKLDFNDEDWLSVEVPCDWEETKFKGYDGVIWFRKVLELIDEDLVNTLELHLGKVDNIDIAYINGVEVGKSYDDVSSSKARIYPIPEGLLKSGKNTIAIRIVDTWGVGGILEKDKPFISDGTNKLYDLRGSWKYKAVARFYLNELYTFGEDEFSFDNEPQLPFVLNQYAPTSLYNAMIAPIIPYKIKGITWYQGESNTSNPVQYETLFPAMINNWRDKWNREDLPFYFVQLAPLKNYDNDKGKNTAELRDAQRLTLSLPNTGMVVLLDAGDKWRIHPGKKQAVGKRLAYWVLANDYGYSDLAYSGPLYKSSRFKDSKAILGFSHVHNGLELKDGDPSIFEIAGKDGVFEPAMAQVDGDKLVVWSDKVKNPTQVRYAWTNWVEPTLFNKDGLPASSFKTE